MKYNEIDKIHQRQQKHLLFKYQAPQTSNF